MVILMAEHRFGGHFSEAHFVVVIIAKPNGFAVKIAKISRQVLRYCLGQVHSSMGPSQMSPYQLWTVWLLTPRRTQPRVRSILAEPSRRSMRQSKQKSIVPVTLRATHRLIRQLDLAGADEAIGDEALKKYAAMYKGQLPKKAIEAIRAVTRLANGNISSTTAALAAEELAAQAQAA